MYRVKISRIEVHKYTVAVATENLEYVMKNWEIRSFEVGQKQTLGDVVVFVKRFESPMVQCSCILEG